MKNIFFLIVMVSLPLAACTATDTISTPTLNQVASATTTTTPRSTQTSTPVFTLTPTISVPETLRFNIEDGTNAKDVQAIKQGVAIGHTYLETILGGDEAADWPDMTINILNADSEVSCCQGLTEGASGYNEPGPRFYALHPEWLNRNALFPGDIFLEHVKHSAHEYAHSWQAAIGCVGGKYGNPLGRWLTEGMAEYVAWNALVQSGELTHEQVVAFHVNSILSQTEQPNFRAWENSDNPFDWWAYNYSYLAVERLIENNGGQLILRKLCEETAKLAPVTNVHDYRNLAIAMQNLDIDREGLYNELDSYFEQLFQLDTSVCLPQTDTNVECLGRRQNQENGYEYFFSIPFAVQEPGNKWIVESPCKFTGFGLSGSDREYNLIVNVSKSTQGTCQAKFVFSTSQQVTVDFLVP